MNFLEAAMDLAMRASMRARLPAVLSFCSWCCVACLVSMVVLCWLSSLLPPPCTAKTPKERWRSIVWLWWRRQDAPLFFFFCEGEEKGLCRLLAVVGCLQIPTSQGACLDEIMGVSCLSTIRFCGGFLRTVGPIRRHRVSDLHRVCDSEW